MYTIDILKKWNIYIIYKDNTCDIYIYISYFYTTYILYTIFILNSIIYIYTHTIYIIYIC